MHKHIFVSSTFQDFQRERDLLQTKVELRTNELLQNLHISFLDLRWGIDTTGEADLEKVVSICIAEVLNSRPFYVVMLGDTYGSCVDSTVVRSLYTLNGLPYDGQQKSVTQIEIEATGLFNGNREYVIVLDRHINQTPDPRAAELKQKVLTAAAPENIYRYEAEFKDGSILPVNEKALIEFIASRLYTFLKDQPALTESYLASLAYEHAQRFCGRQDELNHLYHAVINHKDSPLFRVYAPRGAGLTALLSKLFVQLQEDGTQAVFLSPTSDLPVSFSQTISALSSELKIDSYSAGTFLSQLDPNQQYCFVLDGLDEIEADPTFQLLLRRKQLPKNILFVLGVSTPDSAHFSLDYPSKATALEVFDSILQAHHKEIPQCFRAHFYENIPEEMVRQPAFLMQFISALCYLTEDDYRQLGSSTNFMDALVALFTHKLDHFPENEQAYIRTALADAPESQLWLLGLLSVVPCGLEGKVILGILHNGDIECDLLQLLTVKERFRGSIRCTNDSVYAITRDSFRNAIQRCFTPEQLRYLRYLFIDFLSLNPAVMLSRDCFRWVVNQYLFLEDYALLARLLEANYVSMQDHASANGNYFSLICGDSGADTASRHYLALAKEKNPHCNCWLVKYAMPFVTDLYRQNSTEMFALMYKTVQASGIDDASAGDLFSLYVHGLALLLRTQEAHLITQQEVQNKHIKVLCNGSIIHMYLNACLSYDTDEAASVIDRILKNYDFSQPGIREMLIQILLITERMEGTLQQHLPKLNQFFAKCEQYLLSCQCQQPADIAIPLLYFWYIADIPLAHKEALQDIVKNAVKWDLSLPTNLLFLYMQAYLSQETGTDASQELTDLICTTLESKVALSTLELFYVSAYFTKHCCCSPQAIPPDTAASFAKDLFQRFWNIRGGICSMMQLVEMIRLIGMVCVCKGVEECMELLKPLLADPRLPSNNLLTELNFFRSDAQMLIAVLGEDRAQSLDQLETIIQQRK